MIQTYKKKAISLQILISESRVCSSSNANHQDEMRFFTFVTILAVPLSWALPASEVSPAHSLVSNQATHPSCTKDTDAGKKGALGQGKDDAKQHKYDIDLQGVACIPMLQRNAEKLQQSINQGESSIVES